MGAPDHRSSAASVGPVAYAVLTVSDSRTEATDDSGRLIQRLANEAGHQLADYELVKNDARAIRAALRRFLQGPAQCLVVTGGTGAGRRDITIEVVSPLLDKVLPGFGELFRWLSYQEIGTSTIQSSAEGALCGQTYVFLLPGSTGGVRTGLEKILIPQLDHRLKPCNFVMLLPRIKNEPTGLGGR